MKTLLLILITIASMNTFADEPAKVEERLDSKKCIYADQGGRKTVPKKVVDAPLAEAKKPDAPAVVPK